MSGLWVSGEKIDTISNLLKLQCTYSAQHDFKQVEISLLGTCQPFSPAYSHLIYTNQAIGTCHIAMSKIQMSARALSDKLRSREQPENLWEKLSGNVKLDSGAFLFYSRQGYLNVPIKL